MKKSYAILIALLLVLPMLTVAIPVRASGGTAELGVFDGTNVYVASYNVTVMAGDSAAQNDVSGPTGTFCIILDNVTFSGTQFNLYISKDGFSSISNSDLLYAATFNKADLIAPIHQVNITMVSPNDIMLNEPTTYTIGTTLDGHMIVAGPIPFHITADYKFIKVWDGSSGAVAASTQTITILPALSISPTEGPGGATVTLTGVALAPNELFNITMPDGSVAAQVTTSSSGTFTYTWSIEDLKANYNNYPTVSMLISLIDNASGDTVGTVTFTQDSRAFTHLIDETNGDYDSSVWHANSTYAVDVNVLDTFNVTGWAFNPTANIVISIDGTTVDTVPVSDINASGYFRTTFTIPALSNGNHFVNFTNAGCMLYTAIWVMPTLIVTPNVGPIGTNVTFTAYGFPANSAAYLYFEAPYSQCNYENYWNWVANATVGSDGQFNVTVPWTIPTYVGGNMYIYAWSDFDSNSSPGGYVIADTHFTITPTMTVTPSSLPANGSLFTVTATGLMPNTAYTIDIDNQAFALPNFFSYTYNSYTYSYNGQVYTYNQYFNTGSVQFADSVAWSDNCGNLAIQLVAAGFRPGEHVVALYVSPSDSGAFGDPTVYPGWYTYGFGNYSLNSYALFAVTTEGDAVINATLTEINSTYLSTIGAQITSIQNDVATIQTNTGTIQAAVSALDAKVTSLQGNVATISTNLGTLTGTVTSIQGDVATIKTEVGTIQATTTSIKSFLPVDLTPVWIAVILSLIAAIASIYGIIVIRSKIAA